MRASTAVRDCLFLLTATVFEVDLADREVTMKNLRKQTARSGVIALTEHSAEMGRDTREGRDEKFHRGLERDFDEMGLDYNISIARAVPARARLGKPARLKRAGKHRRRSS